MSSSRMKPPTRKSTARTACAASRPWRPAACISRANATWAGKESSAVRPRAPARAWVAVVARTWSRIERATDANLVAGVVPRPVTGGSSAIMASRTALSRSSLLPTCQ